MADSAMTVGSHQHFGRPELVTRGFESTEAPLGICFSAIGRKPKSMTTAPTIKPIAVRRPNWERPGSPVSPKTEKVPAVVTADQPIPGAIRRRKSLTLRFG